MGFEKKVLSNSFFKVITTFHKYYTNSLDSRSSLVSSDGSTFKPYYPVCVFARQLPQRSVKQLSLRGFIFRFYDQY